MIGAFIQTNANSRTGKVRPIGYVVCESGCWEWVGTLDTHGYGTTWCPVEKRTVRAHRWTWEQAHGKIADGLVIDHLCRNPRCVRPDHLEPVTEQVNILRGIGITAQQAKRTHCTKGHALVPRKGTTWRECAECEREHNRARWHRTNRAAVRKQHRREQREKARAS